MKKGHDSKQFSASDFNDDDPNSLTQFRDSSRESKCKVKYKNEECQIEMRATSFKELKHGVEISNEEFIHSINRAIRSGNVGKVRILLNNLSEKKELASKFKTILINTLDEKKMAPLHYAAQYNRIDIAGLLLKHGAEIEIMGEDGILPLHIASKYCEDLLSDKHKAKSSNDTIIKFLVSKGGCINCKDKFGMTPLHYAAMKGNLNAVKQILSTSKVQFTSFDKEHVETCKNSISELPICPIQHLTPMHLAAKYGNCEIVKSLNEAKHPIKTYNNRLQTPFHKAAEKGHHDIVRYFITVVEKLNPNDLKELMAEKDENENTVLHLAVQNNHYKVVKTLLKNDKTMVIRGCATFRSAYGFIPYIAIGLYNNTVDYTMAATESSADVNIAGPLGVYPLHLASSINNLKIVKLLTEYNSNINCLDEKQSTPLHRAALFGHIEIIDFLIDHGAQIDSKDDNQCTPLLLAAKTGNLQTIQKLIFKKKSYDYILAVDEDGKSIFHWLAECNHYETLTELLKPEYPLTLRSNLIFRKDFYGNDPLHIAANHGYDNVVKILLENGALIRSINEDEETALHIASEFGHLEVVKQLLEKNQSILNAEDKRKNTPLHMAALNGNVEVVRALINAGANKEARNCNLWTPLHCAAYGGKFKNTIKLLHARSAIDTVRKPKRTPHRSAAINGHAEVVDLLLKNGAKINQLTINNDNCLDIAIREHQKEVVLKIINNENWEEAFRNITKSIEHGIHQTPLRKLIRYMPDIAVKVFDKFITDNGESSDDPKYEKYFNYEFLNDIFVSKKNSTLKDVYDDDDKIRKETMLYTKNRNIFEKNHPLMLMITTGRLYLLAHPICTSLVEYKWKNYGGYVYYINFMIYVIYLSLFTTRMLSDYTPCPERIANSTMTCCVLENATECPAALGSCKIHENFNYKNFERPLNICLYVFLVLRMMIKSVEMCFKSLRNIYITILEVYCYFTVVIFTRNITDCSKITGIPSYWQWQMGSIALFLNWIILVLIIRKFHILGLYVVMFMDVLKTFTKFFIVFFLFIIAFGLGFHTLLLYQYPFAKPEKSLLKTGVMMIGEIGFDSIFNVPDNPVYFQEPTYVLTIIFIIIMTIIVVNLLVGLAVDDIKSIQEHAELKRLAMKVELILNIENFLSECFLRKYTVKILKQPQKKIRKCCCKFIHGCLSLFRDSFSLQDYFKTKVDYVQERQDLMDRNIEKIQMQLELLRKHTKIIMKNQKDESKQLKKDRSDEDSC